MHRRAFLTSSLAATGAAALGGVSATQTHAADATAGTREYYELRTYHLVAGPKQKLFEEYVAQAAIPALNRIGIGPVGVFAPTVESENPAVHVLIPYSSINQFAEANDQMRSDKEYQRLGAPFINLPPSDPPYVRVESSLMVAFSGMPKLEKPALKPRLFELRTYESHSKKAAKKKIEMFNVGEIAIFRRAGLQPVFFGETLIGTRLPNLTYMLVYDDRPAHDKAWSAFGKDPEWKKLSTTPGYTDPEIVSKITNVFLQPLACSQI